MRLPLATDLKARVGTPDKDARVKNGIIEIRGESSVVRQRPGVSEASATALGLLAQGGMAFGDYLVIINGDESYYFTYDDQTGFWTFSGGYSLITGSSLSGYDPDASYSIGDVVYYQDPDTGEVSPYYAQIDSPPVGPSSSVPGSYYWSKTPPGASRYQGNLSGYVGAIAANRDAAGYSAWSAYPYQDCATKAPVAKTWLTFSSVLFETGSWRIRCNQYVDNSPLSDCSSQLSLGVASLGTVGNV